MNKITRVAVAVIAAAFTAVAAHANADLFALSASGNANALKGNVDKYNVLKKNAAGETLFHVAKNKATAEVLFETLREAKLSEEVGQVRFVSKDTPASPFNDRMTAKNNAITEIKMLKDNQGSNVFTSAVNKGNTETASYYADLLGFKSSSKTLATTNKDDKGQDKSAFDTVKYYGKKFAKNFVTENAKREPYKFGQGVR
ncbi:hypothetical protein AAIR98_000389 [Elusimicrobium simillimum]|uniref:hypothetical protein n=1 Tax=Elusimicrobium simillimum TaxID=3143438 RepID=UPI003C6EFB1C